MPRLPPDRHALITIQFIDEIRSRFDEAALLRIIDSRGKKVTRAYFDELAGAPTLKERVAKLATMRSRESYMADRREGPDGTFMLVDNHCPICAAASTCQGFCKAGIDKFEEVLGGPAIQVERVDHILAGARRCAYRIQEQKQNRRRVLHKLSATSPRATSQP